MRNTSNLTTALARLVNRAEPPPAVQPSGPSSQCAGGQIICQPAVPFQQVIPRWVDCGYVPTIIALDGGYADSPGGTDRINAPPWVTAAWLASAVQRNHTSSLQSSDTKGAGILDLSISAPAAAAASGQGYLHLTPGFMLTISGNNNTSVTKVTVNVEAYDENDMPLPKWTAQVVPSGQLCRFIFCAHYEDDNGIVKPVLWRVANDVKVVPGGTSVALTAAAAPNDATAIVPTTGIQFTDRVLGISVTQAAANVHFTAETLAAGPDAFSALARVCGLV